MTLACTKAGCSGKVNPNVGVSLITGSIVDGKRQGDDIETAHPCSNCGALHFADGRGVVILGTQIRALFNGSVYHEGEQVPSPPNHEGKLIH